MSGALGLLRSATATVSVTGISPVEETTMPKLIRKRTTEEVWETEPGDAGDDAVEADPVDDAPDEPSEVEQPRRRRR